MTTIKSRGVAAPRRAKSPSAAAGFWIRLGVLVQVIALLAGIFALFSYRVSLSEKITLTARETAKFQKQIHELDREIEALKLKKESYSEWPFIKGQIERYQLGLRPADASQRRLLVIRTVQTRRSGQRVETAQRR